MNNVWSVKERRHARTGAYVVGNDSPGDFIDALIDNLRESSGGSDCFDEDTVRSVLGAMLNEEGE